MTAGAGRRAPLALALLMVTVSMVPLVVADDVGWSGPDALQIVASSNPGAGGGPGPAMGEVTVNGFDIESNGTVLDAWLEVSSGGRPNSTIPIGWAADDPSGNFSYGIHNKTSATLFDGELSLSTKDSVGRVHDLEQLSHRFTDWLPGGTIGIWSVGDPSGLNGSLAPITVSGYLGTQNITARTNGGGHAPRYAADGNLVAMTTPNLPLPGDSLAWLESPFWPIPAVVNELSLEFDSWLHIDTDNDTNGSGGGAWVEASFDGGATWQWVEPLGGYPNTISPNAPVPVGVPTSAGSNGSSGSGTGFPVWASMNATGWQRAMVVLDNVSGLANATSFAFRLVIWTPSGSSDRPGWFVDTLSVGNLGAVPGTWFYGDLTGEYSQNGNASLYLPINLTNTSSPLMIEYATDFDIEGDIYDNLHIEASPDGINWTRVSPVGGIPHHGIYVNGTTYGDDSGGWLSLQHALPASLAGAANASLRFRVETDATPGTGFGGTNINPPEGIFIDDVRIVEGLGTARRTVRDWTFDTATLSHSAHGSSVDEWQHEATMGHNGPWGYFTSLEDTPLIPDGWDIETIRGRGWEFGTLSPGNGPSAWSSGQHGAGIVLDDWYDPDTWTHLISPSLPIPEGTRATLQFEHWICSESGWDAGVLFISTDDGRTWSHFGSQLQGWYETMQWNNSLSPFFGMLSWDGSQRKNGCQNNRTLMPMRADMSQFAGLNVQLRFSFYSDNLFEHDGWYIDDVGIRVDVFEERGNWTSTLLSDDHIMGWDSVELDASIPNGTWVRGTILDSLGRPLTGSGLPSAAAWQNLTFPITLVGLAEEMRGLDAQGISGMDGIKIELQMGSDEPQRTPRIRALSVGTTRLFDASASNGTGWQDEGTSGGSGGTAGNGPIGENGLEFSPDDGNLTNPTLITHGIIGEALLSGRPIESIIINVEGAGVLLDIQDLNGASLYSGAAINGVIHLSRTTSGFLPVIDLQPGGWLHRISFEGITTIPAINASIDLLDDGSDEWAWPRMTEFGPHGWQTQFALGAPGETQLDAAGDSTNRTVPANASHRSIVWNGTGVLTLSMLLPANWQGSAIGTILLRDLADLEGRTVTLAEPSQNQNHSTVEIRKRATALQFSSWFVSFDSANVQDDGFRSWHKYTISLFTSSPGNLSISMAGFSYSLDENVSGLGPSVEAWRNASLSSGGSGSGSGPGDGVLSVPLTYRADLGGVAIDGSVVQSPAIIDEVVTIPDILLPDATVEIVTSHSHLFGTSSLDAAALNLYASDGRIWGYSVAELTGTPEFFSVDDPGDMGVAGVIRLDHNASSVNVVGSSVEITWVLRPDWTVDDVASITVFTEASDATGRIWGPASAIIGAGGSQAIENDLEIIAWTIVDESDRNLLATWDTSYPFYVQPGANLSLTGRVRFEGIQSATVATELWAGAIEVSAGDTVWTTEIGWLLPDDTWIVQVAIPAELADSEDITNLTIKPVLVRVGPIDRSRIGAEDATTLASATIRIDRNTPSVGPLLAQVGGGLRPVDGNTWSPERPLVLSVYLNEVEKFGQTLRLYEWHEAIDDTDNDGIADSHEYQERVRMVGSSILQNQEIDLGAVELQASCCGERISFYIEGEDHSGRAITGGGGPGLENDLATLIIEADVPTVARREDVSIDSTDDYLLLGVKHTLTFKLQDGNGINSLDNVTIYLAGESSTSGALYWDPLLNELTSSADSGVQPIDSSVFESNGNEATISVSFALDDRAPSDWRVTIQSPAIVIFEEGQRLDLEIDQLPNLAWRFDTRTEWVVDSAEDLTAPYGQFYDGSLFIHDGDLINLTAHLIHERTRLPIDLAPVGRSVSIDAGAGVQANVTIGLDGLLNFEAAVPGNGGLDADGTLIATVQNTAEVGWPALHLPLILDRTAPIINFLGTSLVSVNTDLLGEQLVAFTITERGGMGDEKVGFNWRFQRSGIEMLGMTGTATLGPAVDNGDLWDISERVDMRVSGLDLLRDGDQLVVWVTGTDLAGNALVGEGSDANVRSPHLRIIWFDPTIDTVLIAPQPAQFGDDATFDVRLRDLGNGGGTIDLSLWAWEDDGSGVRWIELARTNVTLAPGGVAEAKFSVEMWREGDLSLLLAIDDDIEGGSALPSLHVNPGAGSAGFLGNVVAGEAASIGLLILVFTGIGFMLGVIALRGRDEDVDWDELEDIDYESDADEAVAENVGETRDDGIVNYSGNISGNISERGDATKSRNQPSQKAEIKGGKSRDQQPPARPRDIWPEPPAEFPSDSSTISSDDGSEPGSDEEEE